jgi:hypothetical protein
MNPGQLLHLLGCLIVNPGASLLERIDWPALDQRVSHEQRNREVHVPAISLFRWWARRPHALIGEILDAAGPEVACVSDPFSGGGTVALEAAARGLGIYAQDLHPWAAMGVATALDRVDPKALQEGGREWIEGLTAKRRELYGTTCSTHGDSEILTTFWVRRAECPHCAASAYLYPYSLVTLASRGQAETHAFFGCGACGAITRSRRDAKERRCSGCSCRLPDFSEPQLADGKFRCRERDCRNQFSAFVAAFTWHPVLVQRLCGCLAHIDRPNEAEVAAIMSATHPEVPASLRAAIPEGLETRRLRRAGVKCWADLYPPRQLSSLLNAAAVLEELKLDADVRNRLRLVICGAAEMAGFASRWDRFYPKAFEATANHRFNLTGLSVETNLLAERGRGTLHRRLGHSVRAAKWGKDFEGQSARILASGQRSRLSSADLTRPSVVRGSSTRQLLGDEAVDLVLTDPPYFDDVQYAELGSLFLTWARATSLIGKSVHLDLRSEVVPNATRGAGTARYCELLSAVLRETARTLKSDGRAVLTFHNTNGEAWWALARALGNAGLNVSALAVAHAENETDHAKRGRRAFSHDLVIEARRKPVVPAEVVIASEARDPQSRQLIAAGRAVAELASELASVKAKRTRTFATFGRVYRRHLGDEVSTYIRFGADARKASH